MDNCIEPVVTSNAEPKKMGRAVSYNQMVLLKDSRRRKLKAIPYRTCKMIKIWIFSEILEAVLL